MAETRIPFERLQKVGKTISSDYTVSNKDILLYINANSSDVTIYLPDLLSVTFKNQIELRRVDESDHNVVLISQQEINNDVDRDYFGGITLYTSGNEWFTLS